MFNKPTRINLALQGGGSHGAFTWGVIKRLSEESLIEIEGISGTSSGAVNGSLFAYGLSNPENSPCAPLDFFWTKLGNLFSSFFVPGEDFSNFSFMKPPENNYALDMFLNMTQNFTPHMFNPNDMNPFRDLLEESINFEKLRNNKNIKLFVAATNVKNSRLKVFKRDELTVKHILASACLPSLHHAITIDGETYWDGGFTGNPALYPLVFNCQSSDLLIVLLQPLIRESIPESAKDVQKRFYEIAFHANFLREMRAISFSKQIIKKSSIIKGKLEKYLDNLRIHIIYADEDCINMENKSPYDASSEMLNQLRDAGYRCTDKWLQENLKFIGKKSTTPIDTFSDYPIE